MIAEVLVMALKQIADIPEKCCMGMNWKIHRMSSSESLASSSLDNDGTNSDHRRLENLDWCSCDNCVIMPNLLESKCCKEFGSLLGDKLVTCITDNEHFVDICIEKDVLESAYIHNQRYH